MWLDYESIDNDTPTALKLDPKDPKRDFVMQLLARYGELNANPDPINRCDGAYCSRPNIDLDLQGAEQALSRLTSRPAAGLKVIDQLPEATMLRVETASGQRVVYSLLRNRAHSNVAFLLGESLRYQPGSTRSPFIRGAEQLPELHVQHSRRTSPGLCRRHGKRQRRRQLREDCRSLGRKAQPSAVLAVLP
jgi:hypothetical protein